MILVTGATGTVGSEVARQLIAAGQKPRLLVRNPEKAKAFEGKAEIVKGDLDDAASLSAALKGVDKLFLLTSGVDGPRLEEKAIDQAKAAGVKHVVKLSVIGAEYEALSFGKWHRKSEKKLEASGLAWTFIRPGNFMSNALMWGRHHQGAGRHLPAGGRGQVGAHRPCGHRGGGGEGADHVRARGQGVCAHRAEGALDGRAGGHPLRGVGPEDQLCRRAAGRGGGRHAQGGDAAGSTWTRCSSSTR